MPRITDGFPTIITMGTTGALGTGAGIRLFEKEITPPNITSGGPIDMTTMRNTAWRTKAKKNLKDLGPLTLTAAYATDAITKILTAIGVNQQITVTFADGATLVFWGWLDDFKPGRIVEGQEPTAEVTFQVSNRNASNAETAPAFTPSTDTTGTN